MREVWYSAGDTSTGMRAGGRRGALPSRVATRPTKTGRPVVALAKLTTQAGWVSLGRGVTALAGLATAMVLSRVLPQAEYGAYRQVWLVFYALAPLMELGIPPSVSFYLPRLSGSEIKTYLVQHGLLLLASGGLMSLTFLTLGGLIERLFGSEGLQGMLQAFALFPAMMLPFKLTENALITLGRARLAGGVAGGGAVVQAAVVLVCVLSGGSLAQTFLLISLWALARWLLAAVSLLYLARHHRVLWNLRTLLSQLRFALPIGGAAVAGLGARQIDQFIVSSRFTPAQYAVYINGAYDIPLIHILTVSVTAVLVPALVRARDRRDDEEVRRLWHGAAQRLAWLYFPVFCFLFVTARPLMELLFSEQYVASAGPFRVFLFLLPLRIALHGAFLRVVGRSRPILIASLGALLISGTLAIALVQIRPLGILGPALAATLAAYWAAYYAIKVGVRTMGWRWADYFPWRRLTGIMLVAVAAALPAAWFGHLVADRGPVIHLAVAGLTFAGFYLVIGEWTGAARAREWIRAVGDLLRQR